MDLVLTICLAVLVAACVWMMVDLVKQKKRNERKLQERIEEFNDASDVHITEMQGARHRVEEAMSELAVVRKNYDKLLKEHESLYKEYTTLKNATSHCGCDAKAESKKAAPPKDADKKPVRKVQRKRKAQ